MKKNTYKILLFTVIAAVMSCNEGGTLESKRKDLADLKTEQQKTAESIATLEKEIAKLDTTVRVETNIKLVAIDTLSKSSFKHFIELNGKIETDENITISAINGGTVTRVNVIRGQKVRKGQSMGAVDNDLIVKGMNELKSGLTLANTIFEKQSKLWDQKIGTEIQYLQAKNQKESLELKLESLKKQYELSLFKSTIDGTVDEVFVKSGEMVAPGMPAFRVVNNAGYKLSADVPEAYLSKIAVGNKVYIKLDEIDSEIESSIINVSNVISPNTRTFRIEIALKGDTKNYKANMLANIKILDFKKDNTLVIPINLIENQDDKEFVFVNENKKAIKKEVKIGNTYKNDAEVISGLNEGDQIIVTGYQDLTDGQSIKF